MTDEQTITVQQAENVLRKDYWDDVREMANEAEALVKSGEISDGDELQDWLHESVDDSAWVIYTHNNFIVLLYSDNKSAMVDEMGAAEELVSNGEVNWAGLAYMAMRADVQDTMTAWDDMEKPEDSDSE